jgi:ABC-type multidrug transport system ATPase subunit
LRDVEKLYGKKRVLHIPNLVLSDGDAIVLTGSNGSGKSTLLRILAGISTISRGQINRLFQGQTLRTAYVPQLSSVYQNLTVAENLHLRARLFDRQLEKQLESNMYISALGLDHFLHVPVAKLSGGYARLCTIACMLCIEPDILFLDEPSVGLDEEHKDSFLNLLPALRSRLKLLVLCEHTNTPQKDMKHIHLASGAIA